MSTGGRTQRRHILSCHITATWSASQIATSHWVDCSYVSRVFLLFPFACFASTSAHEEFDGILRRCWPVDLLSFCFLRSSPVKMAKAHRITSRSQRLLEWQCVHGGQVWKGRWNGDTTGQMGWGLTWNKPRTFPEPVVRNLPRNLPRTRGSEAAPAPPRNLYWQSPHG